MTGRSNSDPLAIMARSGLMTHVATLTPPVTAAAMARFRTDAARQAQNVMVISSGTFALSLPEGVAKVSSEVPHTLAPISGVSPEQMRGPRDRAAPAERDSAYGGQAASAPPPAPYKPPPRRIPPPSLRTQEAEARPYAAISAPPGPSPLHLLAEPGDDPNGVRVGATPMAARPHGPQADRGEDLQRISGHLRRMEEATAEAHARAVSALADTEERLSSRLEGAFAGLETRLADALCTGVSYLSDSVARLGADADASAQAGEGRWKARIDALDARLAQAAASAASEQAAAISEVHDTLRALSLAQAEDEARTAEGFAMLRLGFRAMNDRLAELAAQVATLEAGASQTQAPQAPDAVIGGAGSAAFLRSPAPSPDAASRLATDNRGRPHLRAMLGALIDELDAQTPDTGQDTIMPAKNARRLG